MQRLHGTVVLPGDKSISHRAVMLGGITPGKTPVENLALGQDVAATRRCMAALGVSIQQTGETTFTVQGTNRLRAPEHPLDCGNSGTTIRLLAGLLGGANVHATLSGDESLHKRPMKRILDPLTQMGILITAQGPGDCAPLHLAARNTPLHGLDYTLPMASAQVKSAILLAGLFTDSQTRCRVHEPIPSRDHTERMLTAFGATVSQEADYYQLMGRIGDMRPQSVVVPGDISSAAFWLVGAALLPGSAVVFPNIGLNPYRTGVLDVLHTLGVPCHITDPHENTGEPVGRLTVESGGLSGNITLTAEQVPALIDEIPILTVLGLFTDGVFTLRGAEELRHKESDRLDAMIRLLKTLQVDVDVYPDGFAFEGRSNWIVPRIETPIDTRHDHRLVMALEILNLRSATPLPIMGTEWVAVSYPGFYQTLDTVLNT